MKPATLTIHSETNFTNETGAVTPPVFLTSTFASGNQAGFDYTRSGNPNFVNLAKTLAALENAQYATVFGSGMAAVTAVLSGLKSGDKVVIEDNTYGCTVRLFREVLAKFGIEAIYTDLSNPDNYQVITEQKPVLVWFETPTNPLLKIIDIQAVSAVAHQVGASVAVDNTFASPAGQQPLNLGADLSLSSTTKYINGHSDTLGGSVATNSEEWAEKLDFAQKAIGLQPSPFDCWLISRGVKTLAVRMDKHQSNALAITEWLLKQPQIKWVRYPLHKTHPQYELAKKQMQNGSGIVTFETGLNSEETQKLLKQLKLFTFAESLGGIESLVCHPATMSHGSVPSKQRTAMGITDGVVRLSVGIEASEDLINDLAQAF